jgi:para-nitrobenzyl esterase
MGRSIALSAWLLFSTFLASAQCGGRYVWEIFSSVDETPDILYGSNADFEGNTVELYADFYEPAGDDLEQRPLVMLAHGGFFIAGTRKDADIRGICQGLARRGYACASIQYRLGVGLTELDSAGFAKAVVRGVQDAKAAARYFRANASLYGLDTAQFFIGGTSAGGVLSMHYAYLQDTTMLPAWINSLIADLGGLEGSSGTPGFNTRVNGVVSYAGAIKDLAWMGPRAVPVASTHGTEDDVVPYGLGMVTYVLVPGILELPITSMYGSAAIHPWLDARSIDNTFWSFEGAGHVPHIQPGTFTLDPVIFPQTIQWTADFLHRQLACYDPLASVSSPEAQREPGVWPYPASHIVQVEGLEQHVPYTLHILDMAGRTLRSWTEVSEGPLRVARGELPSGMYLLSARTAQGQTAVFRLAFD